MIKRIKAWLSKFFFPPEGTPRWQRLLPYGALGVLTLIALAGATYSWEYTNSPEFCGTACHTMPPEFSSYLTSPHARIDCVECHIGRGFIATRISRKAGDVQHIISLISRDYEFPIRADSLRPARDTCEQCHFPEKFSDDSLREIKTYAEDLENSPLSTYLVMKTGGGSKRQGLGRGIHWHIENPVYYLATTEDEQEIPYVRVINDDGTTTEYVDVESGFDPSEVVEGDLEEMDCITCHNRITHLILPPEDTVDQLIGRGEISADIPEIKRKAVEVYGNIYDTTQKGVNGIAGLEGYYEDYYPEFYAENQELIQRAITALQDAYAKSVFPLQKADWTSHVSNIGHQDSPGCFRCHDGKHLSSQGESIRLECNLCHSIPVVSDQDDFLAEIEISRGPEPASHLDPNWIVVHREVFDNTCQNCHTTGNPGGSDNSSFCSNTACHGNVYTYAGFDAPALRELVQSQLPPTPEPDLPQEETPLTYADSIGMLFERRCTACHSTDGPKGLNLSSYDDLMAGSENGPVVLPGDAENSLLIRVQTGETRHFAQFSQEELDLLVEWIDNGAQESQD